MISDNAVQANAQRRCYVGASVCCTRAFAMKLRSAGGLMGRSLVRDGSGRQYQAEEAEKGGFYSRIANDDVTRPRTERNAHWGVRQ
ncbi:hypothetical protein CH063_00299 [Colletotrichum higginsianum]|uniref:Uncharacterized protein n=1 Tax=Colletotrichum higginsianum (strain IMI 349063) TaxID=759273 RepID=H1VFE4_COLHI|nr:hypothetical protein CH063_00299 [Colletotrichum higginsianum]